MTCRYHKQIKIWLLDQSSFTLEQIREFLVQSIEEAEGLWKQYNQNKFINDTYSGPSAARDHYRDLKKVEDDLQDMKAFILSSRVNGFRSLVGKIDSVLQDVHPTQPNLPIYKLTSYVNELKIAADFEEMFEKSQDHLYNLQTEEKEFCSWENRCAAIKGQSSVLENHPIVSSVYSKIMNIRETKRAIREKLNCFALAGKLDDVFLDLCDHWEQGIVNSSENNLINFFNVFKNLDANGNDIQIKNKGYLDPYLKIILSKERKQDPEWDQFVEYFNKNQESSYIEWLLSELEDLTDTYADNHPTNWVTNIKYKKIDGKPKILNYLTEEKRLCDQNANWLAQIGQCIECSFQNQEIGLDSYMRRADYIDAFSSLLKWLGLSNHIVIEDAPRRNGVDIDAYKREIKPLQSWLLKLSTFEEIKDAEKKIEEDLSFNVLNGNTVFRNLLQASDLIRKMELENEMSVQTKSGWRQLQLKLAASYKLRLVNQFRNFGKTFEEIAVQHEQWRSAWWDIGEAERRRLQRSKFMIGRKKATGTEEINRALERASQIAPEYSELVVKMKSYGLKKEEENNG